MKNFASESNAYSVKISIYNKSSNMKLLSVRKFGHKIRKLLPNHLEPQTFVPIKDRGSPTPKLISLEFFKLLKLVIKNTKCFVSDRFQLSWQIVHQICQ